MSSHSPYDNFSLLPKFTKNTQKQHTQLSILRVLFWNEPMANSENYLFLSLIMHFLIKSTGIMEKASSNTTPHCANDRP